jgi:hypothetical protein
MGAVVGHRMGSISRRTVAFLLWSLDSIVFLQAVKFAALTKVNPIRVWYIAAVPIKTGICENKERISESMSWEGNGNKQ